jgi:AraC family transcriptional regulator
MNVDLIEMPELRIGTVRHTGPYNQIPEAFGRLCDIAGPAGLFEKEGALCLALYHDDPETTPAAELKSDAAITVPAGLPLPEGLTEQTIPAGRYAKTTHVGPYTGLGDTWSRFMGEWLPNSGHTFLGPTYEIYANDPMSTPPDELRTDLYLRVE